MPDLVKMLRDLADAYEKESDLEARGESTKATEERIAALEARLKDAPADDRADAIEELDEDEWRLVQEHRAGRSAPEPEPEPEPDEEEKPKMRRGRKRGRVYQDARGEPGYVYQGEDEPDLVPVEEPAA